MENKEIQEITVEKELPKTLEEYVIKEIESYKKQNAYLADALRISRALNFKLNEEVLELKAKYNELIAKLKEDCNIQLSYSNSLECKFVYFKNSAFYDGYGGKEKYEYYKQLFDLKEEGEEENE